MENYYDKRKNKEEKTQDSSLNPEPKITNTFTHGSHGGIDDEYYINELMGLDDFTYEDWIGDKRLGEQQREEKKKDEYFTSKAFGIRMWKGNK